MTPAEQIHKFARMARRAWWQHLRCRPEDRQWWAGVSHGWMSAARSIQDDENDRADAAPSSTLQPFNLSTSQ